MNRKLVMLTNNRDNDPFIYSQLLDVYNNDSFFSEYVIFTSQNKAKKLKYAQVISNGSESTGLKRYIYYYFNLVRFIYSKSSRNSIYHLRGVVSAILFYLIPKIGFPNPKFIYDPRGLFIMEKMESGKNHFYLRIIKHIEQKLIRDSIFTIVTTEKFKSILSETYGFENKMIVCYNCSSFAPSNNNCINDLNLKVNVCYCGSINYWHDLDEIYRVMLHISELIDNCHFNFFTSRKNHSEVEKKFHAIRENLTVKFVEYEELSNELEKMDICISIVRPTYTSVAASPIKISDYIQLNRKFISNEGIGDFDEYYKNNNSALLYSYGQELEFTKLDIENINTENNNELKRILSTEHNNELIMNNIKISI